MSELNGLIKKAINTRYSDFNHQEVLKEIVSELLDDETSGRVSDNFNEIMYEIIET